MLRAGGQPPRTVAGAAWFHVITNEGVTGWVHGDFVEVIPSPHPPVYRVATDILNVRSLPGTATPVLTVAREGDSLQGTDAAPVTIDGIDWVNVTTSDGFIGWVHSGFVEIVDRQRQDAGEPAAGGLCWGTKMSPAFAARVRAMAATLDCEANHLMAAMAFETGRRFTADVRNQWSGATGLIQFMPATARGLGTTVEALAAMTAEAQLDVVERYLAPYTGKLRTVEDVYMAILWPAAVGLPNDFALFRRGTSAYEGNAGLDTNGDGIVTKQEAAAKVIEALSEGLRAENCR